MAFRSLVFLTLSLISIKGYPAACCGGSSSLPTLITGDYKGQVVLNASNAAVTHDSSEQGTLRKRGANNKEVIETLSLSGAYLVSSYWQVGATLPVRMNSHMTPNREERTVGIGDPKLQLAYEFLPEYGYSWWRPKGFLFLEQSFALSNSTYDASKPLRSDSLGNGLYTTALGASFIKTIQSFDLLFMSEIHQGVKRDFELSGSQFSVLPRLGFSALLGAGLSPFAGNLRIGATLLYSREGERVIRGTINNISTPLYFAELGINVSYLYQNWSFQASYRDQTYLSVASNTPLTKSLGLSAVKFFDL